MSDIKNTNERQGQCLCGAVKVTATSADNKVIACHCDMCRRWGSSPYMEISCGKDVSFEGEENITVYDSSPWAERGFCKKCGTNLFYRLKESGEHQMSVGLFDDVEDLEFDMQVFIDIKPSFYSFKEKTKTMTEAEIVKMYGGGE